MGPQPRLEGLEELKPGSFLISLVVGLIDQREVLRLLHVEEKRLPSKMDVLLTRPPASAGFAGGPWDETAGFARGANERLRVLYAVPFGRVTT